MIFTFLWDQVESSCAGREFKSVFFYVQRIQISSCPYKWQHQKEAVMLCFAVFPFKNCFGSSGWKLKAQTEGAQDWSSKFGKNIVK